MKVLSLVLVTLITSSTLAAQAREIVNHQRPVSFADLDLSREAGIERLYRRIKVAAREVCATSVGIVGIQEVPKARRCAREALARAIAEADVPALTRYHDQHSSARARLALAAAQAR